MISMNLIDVGILNIKFIAVLLVELDKVTQ